ncbi:MAG: NADH-quinone oxidoreductase subunit I [candidate division Zixibacteria bacterium]|nr:NADH-quinone oxidoreductase subunit I [candidate division Zixibacteria bacterium]
MKTLIDGIKNLCIGMVTVGKHLFRRNVTVQYPTERWEMPERSRGIVVLLSDQETGELNCTVCMLCMRACPASAITIEYEQGEKGKRTLKDFIVDNTICCFCGLCEETCNFAAIKMATMYEFATEDKESLIWHMDKLQEMGRDVPYEKPVRKKPAAAKPAPKPEVKADGEKPAEPQPAEAASTGNTAADPAIANEPEQKPDNRKPDQPAEDQT